MKKVKAIEEGYFDEVRKPGDEFEIPDDVKAYPEDKDAWFELIEAEDDKPRRGRPPADKHD